MIKRFILPVLFILIPILAPAQEKIPRQLYIFPVETVSDGGSIRLQLMASRAEALDQYLRISIAEKTGVILVETEEEADCLVRIVINDTEGVMEITVFAVDTFFDRDAFKVVQAVEDFSIIALQDSLLKDLAEQVNTHFPLRDPEVVEVVTEKVVEDLQTKRVYVEGEGNIVTIRGIPGTVLTSATSEVYEIGEEGTLELGFPVGVSVLLDAELKGYFPERISFVIQGEDIDYSLNMVKVSRWVLDARFRLIDFSMSPGVQWFYKPHHGFISFFLDENFLSIGTLAKSLNGYTILTYLMPTLGTGWIFFHPDSGIRIGLSMSLFMRLVVPFDSSPYLSRDMPFGLQPAFYWEFSPWRQLRFYCEWGVKLYYSPGNLSNDYAPDYSSSEGRSWINYWGERRIASQFYVYPFAWYIGGRILF